MEDVMAALENKNPSIKDETMKFLVRTFCQLTQATLPKPLLKQIAPVLIKVCESVAQIFPSMNKLLGIVLKRQSDLHLIMTLQRI